MVYLKLKYQRQVDIPIIYDGKVFDEGLCLDVLTASKELYYNLGVLVPLWLNYYDEIDLTGCAIKL
jgi:hypothetical protein